MRWHRQLRRHRYRYTTAQLLLLLAVLSGLGIAHSGYAMSLGLVLALLPAAAVGLCRRNWLGLGALIVFGVIAGWWRGSVYMQRLAQYDGLYYHAMTVTVRAQEDALYSKTKQLSFAANTVVLDDGRQLTGKLQIGGFGENAIFQNDIVHVTGKLYPSRGAYQGRISFSLLKIQEHHPSLVARLRSKFIAGAQSALPEPLAPFAMGLLIGQRATLPDDTKQDLQRVGLTHIIAVSGYNLTIILQASRKLFGRRSKRMGTVLSVLLIAVFLLLAGSSASIVRAAIVSMLSIAASYYGRSFKPFNLLALAAVITAWANPVYIWSDLSWYLSFLAFYGVMVLGPLIQNRWPGKWHDSLLVGVALESLCAELMTLPFILFIFGQMSRVGLLANVLVVTLVPIAMLLGMIAGLAGMLAGSVAGWFCWPAVILLTYMLDVAHILASLPHVFVQGIGLPLAGMIGLYVVLAWLTFVLMRKTKTVKHAIITDRNEPKYRGLLA